MANNRLNLDGTDLVQPNPLVTSKKLGAPTKALTFTRERAGSLGDIKDYLNRKRTIEDRDHDDTTLDPEDPSQAAKKLYHLTSDTTPTMSGSNFMSITSDSSETTAISILLERLTSQIELMREQAAENTQKTSESR